MSTDLTKAELDKWADEQRRYFHESKLSPMQIKLLEEIPGWAWDSNSCSDPELRTNPEGKRREGSGTAAAVIGGHSFELGVIVVQTWGLGVLIRTFYEVIRVSPRYVWLQELSKSMDGSDANCYYTAPMMDGARGETKKHRASGTDVNFKHGFSEIWNGEPMWEHCLD